MPRGIVAMIASLSAFLPGAAAEASAETRPPVDLRPIGELRTATFALG